MSLTFLHEVYDCNVPVSVRRFIYKLRTGYHIKSAIAYLADEEIRKSNMVRKMTSLRGQYEGQRCFIMGNGPSLNQMDLSLFSNEYVWAANKCYLLFDRIEWRPSFYVAVDIRVVPDIAHEILKLTQQLSETLFFIPDYFRKQWVLPSVQNLYWFHQVGLDKSKLPDGAFTRDAARWVSESNTVTITAMQLAVYLGFNPIYLIGCDTSYTVPQTVQYESGNRFRLVSTQDDDPNHFAPDYFGKGSKWSDPNVAGMIFHYEQTKKVCDSLGVEVYNATVGGNLELFPRVDYADLFK